MSFRCRQIPKATPCSAPWTRPLPLSLPGSSPLWAPALTPHKSPGPHCRVPSHSGHSPRAAWSPGAVGIGVHMEAPQGTWPSSGAPGRLQRGEGEQPPALLPLLCLRPLKHSCTPAPPPAPTFPVDSAAPWSTSGPAWSPLLVQKPFLGSPVSPTPCLGHGSAQEQQENFPQPRALGQTVVALCCPSSD